MSNEVGCLAQKISSEENRIKALMIEIEQLRKREKTLRELRQRKKAEVIAYVCQEHLAKMNVMNLKHHK